MIRTNYIADSCAKKATMSQSNEEDAGDIVLNIESSPTHERDPYRKEFQRMDRQALHLNQQEVSTEEVMKSVPFINLWI